MTHATFAAVLILATPSLDGPAPENDTATAFDAGNEPFRTFAKRDGRPGSTEKRHSHENG